MTGMRSAAFRADRIEAILQLETAGLVDCQPYRGTVATGIDPGRLEEVTALRIDLEGRAAALGVPRLTDADVTEVTRIVDELERRGDDDDFSFGVFNELNSAFHTVLYRAADAPVLSTLIGRLCAEADRIRLDFDLRSPIAEAFHRRILAACSPRPNMHRSAVRIPHHDRRPIPCRPRPGTRARDGLARADDDGIRDRGQLRRSGLIGHRHIDAWNGCDGLPLRHRTC